MKLSPYLNYTGNCKEAFLFYEQLLGGKIQGMFLFGESPMASQVPPEWSDKVMHASLSAGDSVLMGADAPPGRGKPAQGFCVSISLADPSEADRIFQGLADKGTTQMPIQETFWAQRFGMCTDRFGIPWMINCEKPMPA